MELNELALAVPEMLRLARQAVDEILKGDSDFAAAAREQWANASSGLVNLSSHGFYLDIAVPDTAPRLPPPSQGMGEAVADMKGEPTWCMLYATDGVLRFLEVSNAAEWSQPPVFGALQVRRPFNPRVPPEHQGHGA